MIGRKLAYEVVPETEYTDFSDRHEKKKPGNGALIGAGIAATASLSTYAITRIINTPANFTATIPPPLPPSTSPILEPINVLSQIPVSLPVTAYPDMIQTGYIAEKSLSALANILDPLVQVLVAISFPIASVIMIGACFYFMFGQSEKAWTAIMNAGLGYVLIQMSPLFLTILREVGKSM